MVVYSPRNGDWKVTLFCGHFHYFYSRLPLIEVTTKDLASTTTKTTYSTSAKVLGALTKTYKISVTVTKMTVTDVTETTDYAATTAKTTNSGATISQADAIFRSHKLGHKQSNF